MYNERLGEFIKVWSMWTYPWKKFELDISLTIWFKCFPRICPHTRHLDKLAKSLIVHGKAEMQVDGDSGDYLIYLFGNWHIMEEICIHLALYAPLQTYGQYK